MLRWGALFLLAGLGVTLQPADTSPDRARITAFPNARSAADCTARITRDVLDARLIVRCTLDRVGRPRNCSLIEGQEFTPAQREAARCMAGKFTMGRPDGGLTAGEVVDIPVRLRMNVQ